MLIVVVVVPVIAVLLLWLCVSCCWIGNYRAAPGWGPHAATACALLLIEIAAREPSQAEPRRTENALWLARQTIGIAHGQGHVERDKGD